MLLIEDRSDQSIWSVIQYITIDLKRNRDPLSRDVMLCFSEQFSPFESFCERWSWRDPRGALPPEGRAYKIKALFQGLIFTISPVMSFPLIVIYPMLLDFAKCLSVGEPGLKKRMSPRL